MPARFVVTNDGPDSIVTDMLTGQIVFTGSYERAVSQAAELNRQASGYYNPTTVVNTISSGQVVKDDQAGYGDKSRTQDPTDNNLIFKDGRIQPPPDTTSGSNALNPVSVNNTNWGLDDPTRKYSLTQSVSPGLGLRSPGPTLAPGVKLSPSVISDALGFPGGTFGIGGPGDDSGRPNTGAGTGSNVTNSTVSQLNQINYGIVEPQPNVLDQYASYTYQASLYLLPANEYKRLVNTNSKDLSGAQLLVQTGGASAGVYNSFAATPTQYGAFGESPTGATTAGRTVGRNEYFKLDYYIDDIEIHTKIAGGATRLAHNVADFSFSVIEPNGISFLQNLDAAVQQFLGGAEGKKKNYAAQNYLMVIRFYGYDSQGNLVRGGVSTPNQTSDPNAFVEKWYPLMIKDVKFRLASKIVEYQIKAAVVPYYIGGATARGTIPFNVEMSGQTIKDILAGPAVYAANQNAVQLSAGRAAAARAAFAITDPRRLDQAANTAQTVASAPPKANAATTAKKTVRKGLMAALNEYQQNLKKDGIITYPDTYEIEFAIDALANAKIINPSGLNKSATSMSTPGTAADQKLGTKQSMDPNSRIQGATAGMQIVQFIDNLLRNSTYIKDQQIVLKDEKTGDVKATGINIANTSWYKISFSATQGQYDPLRNDYAYNIKYTISPYKIAQLNSAYFKQPQYTGSHKQYAYWFTGENESVIDYEERLDHLYYSIISGITDAKKTTSNALEILKFQYQTASGQSDQSAKNGANEPAANAADQLYSPSDLGECNLTIVGDPAWLQQGEAATGISSRDQFYYQPFLADGTINFDSQQVLFDIGYNTPVDYDLTTGLINPNRGKLNNIQQLNQNIRAHGPTQVNRVYLAKEVFSHFKKGKFTQNLKGTLRTFYTDAELLNQGRSPVAAATTVNQAKKVSTPAPAWNPTSERSSVTNPTPSSAIAKGTQQILTPAVQADNPTLSQLQASPVYIQARRNGATPAAALDAARAAFAAGTNNAANFAAPGIRTGPQQIVKDQ